MSASLIDRVRERLAAESAPLRPNVVAAAIRAESGGVLGDTEVLSNLRVLQTELTGAGILEPLLCADGTTDVLVTAPDAVWVDDGNGLRRSMPKPCSRPGWSTRHRVSTSSTSVRIPPGEAPTHETARRHGRSTRSRHINLSSHTWGRWASI